MPFLPTRKQPSSKFEATRSTAVFAAITALIFVAAINSARAQTYQTWRGENTQGNLFNSSAWWNFPNNSTMVFGQQEFDNNVQTTMTNNNGGSVFSTWRWVFKAGASSARTITGDGIRFFDFGGQDGGIHNESTATHVFNVAIEGDGTGDPFQIQLNSTGGLTFGSTVNNQGTNIDILGTASGAKTVTFSGVVSGSGGMFVNNANATVLFDAANSQSGQLTINAGTVRLGGTGDTFGASAQAIRIGAGALLDLNNVSTTVGSVGEEGLADGGTISLGSAVLTIGGSATTFQNSISGTGGITHSGSGTLNLYGTQSYTGTTTVSGGKISSGMAMASTNITVSGGTYETTADNVMVDGASLTVNSGTLAVGGSDTVASLSGSGGNVGIASGKTLTVNETGDKAYTGAITNAGGLTKTGAGTTMLAGANTYTGTTTIGGGTLALFWGSAIANTGVVTLSNLSGATLAVNASETIGSLRGGGGTGGNVSVANNQTLTVAETGVQTYAGAISGLGGLTKSGAGTMTLSANSSYSGATTVSAGTLVYNGNNTSTAVGISTGATLAGSGSVGATTVNSGGTMSPGNSPGTQTYSSLTWEGGGNYNWQLYNATGAAGTGYDTFTSSGAFAINANSGSKFNVNLWTLSSISPSDVNGNAINFASTNNYSWTLGTFGSISGFSADAFSINTAAANGTGGFANAFGGAFSISTNATQLLLVYTAPSTIYDITVTSGSQTQSEASGGAALLSGALAAVNKLGAGTLVMTNTANDYTGVTTVKAGTLQIDTAVGSSGNTLLGNASSAVVVGDTTTNTAAAFNFGAAVQNDRGLSVVAGTAAAGRTIGTTIGSGTATQAGTVVMATNTDYSAASGGTLQVSGVISGAGNATVTNAGTVVFSGGNTYTGTTTLSSNSTLVAANNSALGSTNGATTVNSGSTLALSNNLSTGENIAIAGSGVGGNGALRNISGANTNSGTITLLAEGTIAVDAGSSLSLNNISLTNANNRSVTLTGAGNSTLTGSVSTFSGSLTNNIIKDGSGTLTVNNNGTSGTGQLNIIGGTVTIANGSISTSTSTGTRAIDLGISTVTATTNNVALYANSGLTVSNSIYVAPNNNSSTRTVGTESTSGTATFNREIYLGGDVIVTAAGGGTALFSGNIINSGNLTKSGNGIVTLSGANTFGGNVAVNAGTLNLSGGAALNDTNAVSISNGATLNLASSETIGSLSGAGSVSLGANDLVTGGNNSNTALTGVISGSGQVFKAGTGTMTLGGANTYTGTLTINFGAVALTNGGTFGGTNAVRIGSSGSLRLNNIDAEVASVGEVGSGNGGIIDLGSGTLSVSGNAYSVYQNSVSGTGGLTKSGSGTLNLYGTQSFSGPVSVSGGELNSSVALTATTYSVSGGLLGSSSASVFADTANFTLTGTGTLRVGGSDTVGTISGASGTAVTVTNGTLTTTYGSGSNALASSISGAGIFAKAGAGTLSLTGTSTGIGSLSVTGGRLQVGDGGTTGNIGNVNVAVSTGADLAVNRSDNLTYGGAASGAGSLVKLGANTLTLSGANTYTGATTIIGGTLLVTNGSAIADTGAVTAESGSTFALGSSETIGSLAGAGDLSLGASQLITGGNNTSTTFSGIASGSGNIVKQGTGTMAFAGGNTFTGGLYIDNGSADIAGGSLAAGVIEIGGGSAGGAQPGNNAKLTISNNDTVSRTITVNGETNNVGASGLRTIEFANPSATTATLSGAISLEKQVFVSVNSNVTGALSGVISGAGSIVKQGSGTLTLSGANAFTNGLFIDAGTANLAGGSLASGVIDIGGGAQGNVVNASDAKLLVSTNGSYAQTININAETNSAGISGARLIEFANATSTTATLSGSASFEKTALVEVATDATGVMSGAISGVGGLTKSGNGTLTLSGASGNTYSGLTTVSAGTLNLNKASGNAIAGATTISSGAVLLLSGSNQVDSGEGDLVTLSGGTIRRGGNVSEVFGNLSVTTASFLDYGAANSTGTLSFGTYAPSALLTVQNFLPGNVLTFGSNLTSSINNASLFSLGAQGFTSSWSSGTSTFTITAIPEPSTYVAAAGLLAMFLWPLRRRLIKDAKSILGLRAPARERFGS
jgi:autotransporter-associated beta strand protein